MGKGKKDRIKRNKQLKNEELPTEECKHIDADELEQEEAVELSPEEQAFIDYGFHKMDRNELLRHIDETEEMDEILALTSCKDERVRLKATREMCPCHVKADREEFWDRIFKLAHDDSEEIRYQVLHNMCDGSPPHLEDKVMKTLEIFNRDSSKKIRRAAHQVMGSYLHTGEWNVM